MDSMTGCECRKITQKKHSNFSRTKKVSEHSKAGEQKVKLGVMAQGCHPSTQGMEAGKSGVQDHPLLHREFESSTDLMTLTGKPVKEKKSVSLICKFNSFSIHKQGTIRNES